MKDVIGDAEGRQERELKTARARYKRIFGEEPKKRWNAYELNQASNNQLKIPFAASSDPAEIQLENDQLKIRKLLDNLVANAVGGGPELNRFMKSAVAFKDLWYAIDEVNEEVEELKAFAASHTFRCARNFPGFTGGKKYFGVKNGFDGWKLINDGDFIVTLFGEVVDDHFVVTKL